MGWGGPARERLGLTKGGRDDEPGEKELNEIRFSWIYCYYVMRAGGWLLGVLIVVHHPRKRERAMVDGVARARARARKEMAPIAQKSLRDNGLREEELGLGGPLVCERATKLSLKERNPSFATGLTSRLHGSSSRLATMIKVKYQQYLTRRGRQLQLESRASRAARAGSHPARHRR